MTDGGCMCHWALLPLPLTALHPNCANCIPTRHYPPPPKQSKTRLARQKYSKALKGLDRALDLETEEQFNEAAALKASCLLNLARCSEKEQEWGEALRSCTKAIK